MRTAKTDQIGRMPRLICFRWVHSHFVGFVMSRLVSIFFKELCSGCLGVCLFHYPSPVLWLILTADMLHLKRHYFKDIFLNFITIVYGPVRRLLKKFFFFLQCGCECKEKSDLRPKLGVWTQFLVKNCMILKYFAHLPPHPTCVRACVYDVISLTSVLDVSCSYWLNVMRLATVT